MKQPLRSRTRAQPVVISKTLPNDELVRAELWHDDAGLGWVTLHWDIPQPDGSMHRYTEDKPETDFPAADVAAVTALLDKLVAMP